MMKFVGIFAVTSAGIGCSSPPPSDGGRLSRAPTASATDANGEVATTCDIATSVADWSCRGELPTDLCAQDWADLDKVVQCNVCRYHVGEVAGLLTRFTNCNPRGNGGGVSCFYDVGTGKLAGAFQLSDVGTYCCGSIMQLSGVVTPEIVAEVDALATPKCDPDGRTN